MDEDLKRYEVFGWDYEYFNQLTDQEVAWYKKFASETGGPVLELACGTGRLLAHLAEQEFEIVGIDLSQSMLGLAAKNILQLAPEAQNRVQLHQMDMSNFQLDRRFGLIYVADNSFRELNTKQQQRSCLKCVYHHLQPGGKFLVTERRFDRSKFVNGRRQFQWSKPIRHPGSGNLVQRKVETQLTENGKWIKGRFIYKTTRSDGTESIEECPIEAPIMSTEDYTQLFFEAGFSTTVYVGYQEREDDGQDPLLCFVCSKRQ